MFSFKVKVYHSSQILLFIYKFTFKRHQDVWNNIHFFKICNFVYLNVSLYTKCLCKYFKWNAEVIISSFSIKSWLRKTLFSWLGFMIYSTAEWNVLVCKLLYYFTYHYLICFCIFIRLASGSKFLNNDVKQSIQL